MDEIFYQPPSSPSITFEMRNVSPTVDGKTSGKSRGTDQGLGIGAIEHR